MKIWVEGECTLYRMAYSIYCIICVEKTMYIVDQDHQRSVIVMTILESLKALSRWQTHNLWIRKSKIGEYLSRISGKRKRKLLLELEKKESKRLISCQKLLEEINKSPQHNQQAEPEQWNSEVEVMYLPKPGNWLSISENTGAI